MSIIEVNPSNDSNEAKITSAISVEASQAITNIQLSEVSFSLETDGQPVSGDIDLIRGAVVFTPDAPLEYETSYTASFETNDGSIESITWVFTTIADPNPFTLTIKTNENGEVIYTDKRITLDLSRSLNLANVGPFDFKLRDNKGNVIPTIIEDIDSQGTSITLWVSDPLEYEAQYELELTNSWFSLDGKSLKMENALTFVTERDTYPPELEISFPNNGAENVSASAAFELYFSEAISPESAVPKNFSITYVDTDEPIEYSMLYEQDGCKITLLPTEPLAYESSVQIIVHSSLSDVAGNLLGADQAISVQTIRDNEAPRLISTTLDGQSTGFHPESPIIIEFSEIIELQETSLNTNRIIRHKNGSQYSYVEVNATVTGNLLTLKPSAPLSYNETYSLDCYYLSDVVDSSGNAFYSNQVIEFKTQYYHNKIFIGYSIDAFELDQDSNLLYAVTKADKKLIVIDLTNDTVVSSHNLSEAPSNLCIDPAGDRLYFTNMNNSFISVYNLTNMNKTAEIPWSAGNWGSEAAHYHIKCDENFLYVTDALWSPRLLKISRTPPYAQMTISTIESVGDFYLASDGGIYIWFQYGWSAGYAGSRIERYDNEAGCYALLDETAEGYPQFKRDPLNAPIFVSESDDLIIHKQYIFSRKNLEHVIHAFGENVVFYAADFINGYIATKETVYRLNDYSAVLSLPVKNSSGLFFDIEGDLYLIDNRSSGIYYLPAGEFN